MAFARVLGCVGSNDIPFTPSRKNRLAAPTFVESRMGRPLRHAS
jgi:hypothetical protein